MAPGKSIVLNWPPLSRYRTTEAVEQTGYRKRASNDVVKIRAGSKSSTGNTKGVNRAEALSGETENLSEKTPHTPHLRFYANSPRQEKANRFVSSPPFGSELFDFEQNLASANRKFVSALGLLRFRPSPALPEECLFNTEQPLGYFPPNICDSADVDELDAAAIPAGRLPVLAVNRTRRQSPEIAREITV